MPPLRLEIFSDSPQSCSSYPGSRALDLTQYQLDLGEGDTTGVETPEDLVDQSFIFSFHREESDRFNIGVDEDVPKCREIRPDKDLHRNVDC